MKQAKLDKKETPVDAIAVTYGPGLEMCLWEGITFAKDLAEKWSAGRRNAVPIIPVNHMEGHVLSVFGKDKGSFKIPKIKTPAISLLVSGGHTQLVLMKKWMDYEIIGKPDVVLNFQFPLNKLVKFVHIDIYQKLGG